MIRTALTGVVAAGLLVTGCSTTDRQTAPNAREAHTQSGAAAAAVADVVSLARPDAVDPTKSRSIVDSLASPDAVPALLARLTVTPAAEDATGVVADLTARRPFVARCAPIGVHVSTYDGETATVSVWLVSVLGTSRLGVADMSWSTETVTLAWQQSRWLLTAYDSESGPVPRGTQAETPYADMLRFVSQLEGMSYAPQM